MAKGVEIIGNEVKLSWTNVDGEENSDIFDKVLVTVGRKPNTQGWGIEEMGIKLDKD